MFGQCQPVLIEPKLSRSMVDDADRRRQRCNVVAIPTQRKELVLCPKFACQFVQAIARMLDYMRPKLAGQPLDLGRPIWHGTAHLIAFQEQPEQVGLWAGTTEQERKKVLLGAVPGNEIPVMIEEVSGIRIEGIDKTLMAGVRRRHRRDRRLMYPGQVEQVGSLSCVEAKRTRQAGEHFGGNAIGAALLKAGQPRHTNSGEHCHFFTSKSRGSTIGPAV